jgi:hypothetical protein
MWGPTREMLIEQHEFYLAEARRRLLDQFQDDAMNAEAERHGEEWLFRLAGEGDPDSAYEQAIDRSADYYQSLATLRDATRLSIIAGMFHEWEKRLRDWLSIEFGHLGFREAMHQAVWKTNLEGVLDLFTLCGWPVRERPYWPDLELCRLVTNVYKHGRGPSFERLRELAPQLLGNEGLIPAYFVSFLDYTSLTVTDGDIARFGAAITAFWRDVPENIFFSQVARVPDWLDRALRQADG